MVDLIKNIEEKNNAAAFSNPTDKQHNTASSSESGGKTGKNNNPRHGREFRKKHFREGSPRSIAVAGGGAHKYEKLFSDALNIKFEIQKELEAVVEGLRFLIDRLDCFTDGVLMIDEAGEEVPVKVERDESLFHQSGEEFLLVNIGSGIITPNSY